MACEVSYDPPDCLPDAALLLTSAERLKTIPEAADREACFATLFKLVDGILATPEEAKKRKIKKNNATIQQKVARFSAAVQFLLGAGFVESDDPDVEGDLGKKALLSMPVAYLLRLTDAHHTLARAATEVGLPAPPLPASSGGFNPYRSIQQAADTTRTLKAGEAWKSDAEKTREEVRKREREMKEKVESAPPIDLKPTAFWHSAGRRLEDVVKETQFAEEDRAADNALLQTQVASAKAAIAGAHSKFESADKRRLAELSHRRVHEFCILRVVCPDKSVLQAHFRACEKGEKVMALIAPLLSAHVRELPWYIYQSPPMKKLAPKETLAAAGFAPGASLYLGFEGGNRPAGPYLEASLVEQLGPAPQEAGRGVNAPAGPTFSGEAMGWGSGKRLGGPGPAPEAAPAAAATTAPAAAPAPAGDAAAQEPTPMED
mmetsp:Transcript_57290/g.121810  ORF Transcript_57290/g.121810 Transcript_57290/m.121810 type:complete len:432 (-) Transcript_57290:87-1382(-)|eukprot:CAMPEP_0206466002 /NCGR_PEP_ID=MMETSP0324_2-20121206/28181_1 /ASSEMBLY_ACC=CAM_ASM_000836 /TAXON_ID=2866 /ORGANISM="Crypthecodinium cohnii, Strain Seligo" /LENGTH=431 /DNA_ID=CAMNT_0053938999 /DNA_START=90 /DNA_END=1385 /DNA_ORIENTATION=-